MSALVRNNTFACTKLVQQHIGFSSSQWRLFLLYVWYCCCINAATENLFFRLKLREDDRMREKTLHTKKNANEFRNEWQRLHTKMPHLKSLTADTT